MKHDEKLYVCSAALVIRILFEFSTSNECLLHMQRHLLIRKSASRSYSALRIKFFADIWTSSAFRNICMRFYAVFAMFLQCFYLILDSRHFMST